MFEKLLGQVPSYSLVILLCGFTTLFITTGTCFTVSIYYVAWMEEFESGSGLISWIGSLNIGVMCAAGPLSSIMTNRFGYRITVIVGSLFAAIGMVATVFAPNVYVLLITFGIITPIGSGIAYIPGSTIVSHYFDTWRVLANGIMMCGGGSGNFAMAYIMTASIEHFGWRGSMFIIAGIYLNLCVVGVLIRKPPVAGDHQTAEVKRAKIVQLGMFKKFNYVMLLCHIFLLTCGLSIIYVHITAFAEERIGLTKSESYLVISLLGIFNVVGRIAQGLGGQYEKVDILTLYLTCLFLSGIFAATYPTTLSFAGVLGFSSVIGFLIAPYGGLILIVLQQFVGLRLLTAAYGYVMLSSAFGFSLGAPIAGWVYDITHDYSNSFYLGGAFIMSSCLLMFWPWLQGVRHSPNQTKMAKAFSAELKPYIFGSSILMNDMSDLPVENGEVAEGMLRGSTLQVPGASHSIHIAVENEDEQDIASIGPVED